MGVLRWIVVLTYMWFSFMVDVSQPKRRVGCIALMIISWPDGAFEPRGCGKPSSGCAENGRLRPRRFDGVTLQNTVVAPCLAVCVNVQKMQLDGLVVLDPSHARSTCLGSALAEPERGHTWPAGQGRCRRWCCLASLEIAHLGR